MEELSKIINHKIKESDLYKEYIFYKNQIDNNEIICKQKEELECLKNRVCKGRKEEDVNEYYKLEKEYKSHLIVKEYLRVKEELYDLLKDIVDILSVN